MSVHTARGSGLPAREEYYRPVQAARLRERAGRLEWCYSLLIDLALLFFAVSLGVLLWHMPGGWTPATVTFASAFAFMPMPLLALSALLERWADNCCCAALRLEGEHQARYEASSPTKPL